MGSDVSPARAHALFELVGGMLIRRVPQGKARAGSVAGNRHNAGYLRVRVDGVYHLCHRIVWIMEYGPIPAGERIDHRNNVRTDNRPENLRLAGQFGNAQNTLLSTRNTSGRKGVSLHASGKWLVQLNANNQYYYGGLFSSFVDACEHARTMRTKLHGAFARAEV